MISLVQVCESGESGPILGDVMDYKTHFYSCKHLKSNGDCGIYKDRPGMCRKYPGDKLCEYPDCESVFVGNQ